MDFWYGLLNVASDQSLLLAVFAAAITGILIGVFPGFTTASAIAMLVPITYYLDPLVALAFLYVVGKSGRYGGSISSILLNTPGTSASIVTQRDGYPLTRQHKAGKALKVAIISSVLGDLIGDILLIVGITWIVSFALMLGPPEYFSIYFLAFVIVSSLMGKSVVKGIASSALGMTISFIGLDPIYGVERFTFDHQSLIGGISLVPLTIGLFTLAQVFVQLELKTGAKSANGEAEVDADHSLSWSEYKPCVPIVIRSSLVGSAIGVLPGIGSTIASFIAYSTERGRSKHPERWGTGILEGVAAPEAASHAVSGPSMAPLLTLGIPGSTIGAILATAFVIHGIPIGPSLLTDSNELIYSLFAAGLFGITFYGVIGYCLASTIGRWMVRIPTNTIYPHILILSFIAAYSVRSDFFDVVVMLVAGILGWIMHKLEFSRAALLISFVLSQGAEEALRQSLLMSGDGWGIFLSRPISLAFMALGGAICIAKFRSFVLFARQTA